MPAKVLMVQGTASSVGKTLLTAALCRHFARLGVRTAPFKGQNMSNNAAVTPGGGEIGRAQALQARACGIDPHVDMNPVLLKPETDRRSQVVVLGKPRGHLSATSYREGREALWPEVTAALDRLRSRHELVIIEGAGSPSEINLRATDIVNMRVALHAQAPVLLVGDIDRGGVFASLLGTVEWLAPEERALVRGFVINRFRGDPTLLAPAPQLLEERSGIPVLGVVPYLDSLRLPEEDAVALDGAERVGANGEGLDVAAVRFPRIANFDDLDPLVHEPVANVRYVDTPAALGDPDLIVLPGTKSTLADLAWLHERGLGKAIVASHRRGSAVVGLCGGYQMLGRTVRDAEGLEGIAGELPGLGLLPGDTVFRQDKTTRLVSGRVQAARGLLSYALDAAVRGYEIHAGSTERTTDTPLLLDDDTRTPRPEGALSDDGWVMGTYLHGLFQNDDLRTSMLRAVAERRGKPWRTSTNEAEATVERELDRLADAVEAALDMRAIHAMAGVGVPAGR